MPGSGTLEKAIIPVSIRSPEGTAASARMTAPGPESRSATEAGVIAMPVSAYYPPGNGTQLNPGSFAR